MSGARLRSSMLLPKSGSLNPAFSVSEGGDGTASTAAATVALFKAVVGTGVFAYPPAVRETGYVLATSVALFFFVINLYTMRVLNLAIVCLRRNEMRDGTLAVGGRVEYHELTSHIFSRPVNGAFMAVAVIGQLGTLASMTVFVCDQIVPLAPALHEWMVALGMAIIVTPLTWLRTTDSRFFQFSMQLGSVAVLTGLATVVYYGAGPHHGFHYASAELSPHTSNHEDTAARSTTAATDSSPLVIADWRGLSVTFSICAMMFSAHMESVSIEQDMANRASYGRTLVATQIAIAVLYLGFGFLVYLFFGAATGRFCGLLPPVATAQNEYSSGAGAGEQWGVDGSGSGGGGRSHNRASTIILPECSSTDQQLLNSTLECLAATAGSGPTIDGEHKLCWSEQTIFQNIPPGPFFTTVKLAVSVNLIFMYPVTMLPASKAVEEFIGIDAARQRVASACCRTAIVAAMSITGMLLPSFEFLQALTGSLTMFTALSMPPYAYWLLATPGEMSRAHVVWCWFVLAFGLVCTVFSTVQTIYNWVEQP